jgi:hypothetical protein
VIRTAGRWWCDRLAARADERYTSMAILLQLDVEASSASGITATVAVEVWIRPCDSVSGTR